MVGIVGSHKCYTIVISSLKFWVKYFCKTVVYDMLGCFLSSKCSFSSFYRFSLLFVTILPIRFGNDSDKFFFLCGGLQLV